MGDVAIRVQGLSKRYRIGARQERYYTLRDTLTEAVARPFQKLASFFSRNGAGSRTLDASSIWALKDVSFEVKRGEVLGIIGRNGAGKSTLLKILSRITEPTEGRVRIRGRVGSLLEVGTGFHPELTGRENIYLNGAILGMRKAEIERKFDEIVAFAEVEKFIATPVKHYSSGMYVRLAFAVAAHLEPEIMIVDEVLAVGDATFQKKCTDRMSALAASGKTVLFVSHNMELIPRLCTKVILLEHGQVRKQGQSEAIVGEYLAGQLINENGDNLAHKTRTGSGRARFTRLQSVDSRGRALLNHTCGEDLILRMEIVSEYDIPDVAIATVLKTLSGTRIITSWTREAGFPVALHKGSQIYQCRFREVKLRPGHSISFSLWMESQGEVMDSIEDARIIQVADGRGTHYLSTERYQGIVVCDYDWSQVKGSLSPEDGE